MIDAVDQIIPAVGETLEVGSAWAGFPVGFALLTAAPWQFAAYYDANRTEDGGSLEGKPAPFTLIWQSLPENRDEPLEGPPSSWPPPAKLKLIQTSSP